MSNTRAIIFLPSQSRYAPAAIGQFQLGCGHSEAHVWRGQALTIDEFNEHVASALAEAAAFGVPASVRLFEVVPPVIPDPDLPPARESLLKPSKKKGQ